MLNKRTLNIGPSTICSVGAEAAIVQKRADIEITKKRD